MWFTPRYCTISLSLGFCIFNNSFLIRWYFIIHAHNLKGARAAAFYHKDKKRWGGEKNRRTQLDICLFFWYGKFRFAVFNWQVIRLSTSSNGSFNLANSYHVVYLYAFAKFLALGFVSRQQSRVCYAWLLRRERLLRLWLLDVLLKLEMDSWDSI